MVTPAPDRVDQILYSWSESNLLTGRGYGPVASSQSADAELRAVDARLSRLARVADSRHVARPPWSLCLVRGPHWAAVLRRSRNEENERYDVGHALVGHPEVINPTLALALLRWPRWHRDGPLPGALAPVTGEALWDEFAARALELDERCAKFEHALAAALTMRLRDPAGRIGLLLPDHLVPDDTVTVLWGVHRIMSALVHGLAEPRTGTETFATYAPQVSDAAHEKLALVCSPYAGAAGSFGPSRPVCRPFDAAEADPIAYGLVGRYLGSGRKALQEILDAGGLYGILRFEDRLTALTTTLRQPAAIPVPVPVPAVPEPEPEQATSIAAPAPGLVPVPEGEPPMQLVLDDLAALESASRGQLLRIAITLRRDAEPLTPAERRPVFERLAARNFHVARLRGLRGDEARTVLHALIATALGPDLGAVRHDQWLTLLSPETPDATVLAVWAHAVEQNSWAVLLPWLELRHVRREMTPFDRLETPRIRRADDRLRALVTVPIAGSALLAVLVIGIALGAWMAA